MLRILKSYAFISHRCPFDIVPNCSGTGTFIYNILISMPKTLGPRQMAHAIIYIKSTSTIIADYLNHTT